MSDLTYVEVGLQDRLFSAVQSEAERLGLSPDQVVHRATAAWICEMAENCGAIAVPKTAETGARAN